MSQKNNKNRVIYIVSDLDKSLEFEWVIQDWNFSLFELGFILINCQGSKLEDVILERGLLVKSIKVSNYFQWIRASLQISVMLRKLKPGIIHCHLLKAGIVGLTASVLANIRKRIYTRHHGSYHHQYKKKGVLLDRYTNWLSTHIVAISQNVKNILINLDKAPKRKVRIINHGFKLETFQLPVPTRIKKVKEKYALCDRYPVVGVVSRFFELKGIQYIIPAFKKTLKKYPEAVLVLANATGPFTTQIEYLLSSIPQKNYRLISFENDIGSLFNTFDCFIHTPIDPQVEAFGQTYVEAMATGVPSVFTRSGIGAEIVDDEKNSLCVAFKDSDAIHTALLRILNSSELRERLKIGGQNTSTKFKFERMMTKLNTLYSE